MWVHEIKHGGFRFIVCREGGGVRVFTRSGFDWTVRAPGIAEAVRRLRVRSVVLDGEAVVSDHRGVTDFDRLRSALSRGSAEAFLCAFDIMELDGADLRSLPWEERRRALMSVLRYRQGIVLSEHVDGKHGPAFFRAACERGLEGIVSKRRYSHYRSGRSPDWVKVKNPGAPAATRDFER